MPTTLTKSVGTASRDYSTGPLAAAALPSSLVTADQKWIFEFYNDSEFTGTGILFDSSGKTCDATRNIVLTAAAGQSYKDHANVRTNPLKYNASNGVGLRSSTGSWVIRPGGAYTEVRRLQVSATGAGGIGINGAVNEGTARKYIDCIIDSVSHYGLTMYDAALAVNVHHAATGTGGNGFQVGGGSTVIGCTTVRCSDQTVSNTGFTTNYGTNIMQSCAAFGYTNAADAAGWHATSSKYNATDKASGLPGTNNQHSVTYTRTTPFTDAISTSMNFIPIASTSLAANGFRDATNAPNDITGTARTATPTIGAWEITAGGGGGGGTGAAMYHHLQMIGAY
ncbi:MAG: hypothetical protein ABIY63_13310 [Fibrobacteria bacterium]